MDGRLRVTHLEHHIKLFHSGNSISYVKCPVCSGSGSFHTDPCYACKATGSITIKENEDFERSVMSMIKSINFQNY